MGYHFFPSKEITEITSNVANNGVWKETLTAKSYRTSSSFRKDNKTDSKRDGNIAVERPLLGDRRPVRGARKELVKGAVDHLKITEGEGFNDNGDELPGSLFHKTGGGALGVLVLGPW